MAFDVDDIYAVNNLYQIAYKDKSHKGHDPIPLVWVRMVDNRIISGFNLNYLPILVSGGNLEAYKYIQLEESTRWLRKNRNSPQVEKFLNTLGWIKEKELGKTGEVDINIIIPKPYWGIFRNYKIKNIAYSKKVDIKLWDDEDMLGNG